MATGPTAGSYLDQANRLRVAAAWNQFDSQATEAGWTIIPVFDADVVKLFLDPKNEAKYVEPISASGPKEEKAQENSLHLFAKITAEFIFLSNDLEVDGRIHRRLWQTKPLLTPSHAEDVAGMIQEVERKLSQAGTDLRRATIDETAIHWARQALSEAQARCTQAQADGSDVEAMEALSSVEQNVPSALRGFLGGPAIEALRFVRMVDEELVVPLASSPDADDEVLSPPRHLVRSWNSRIWDAKKNATTKSIRNAKRNAERDAIAITQVEMLNQRALADRSTRRRYVLITGDPTLHRLYDEQFWKDQHQPLQEYILRHPVQYVPFLNFKAMPNDYKQDGLFQELTSSLDNLIWKEARSSPSYKYSLTALSRHARVARLSGAPSADTEVRLSEMGRLWWRAIKLANAFNFRLAIRDDVRRLSELFEFLALPRISDALINSQHGLLNDIGAAHLAIGVVDTLKACVADAAQYRREGHNINLARVPLPLVTSFAPFIGDNTLVEFLERLLSDTVSGNVQLAQITRKMHGNLGPAALLFASATAAAAGRWGAAEQFVDRILRGGGRQSAAQPADNELDAAFLKALILRFDLEDIDDYQEALRHLDSLARNRNPLQRLRALSERAALRLAFFVHCRLKAAPDPKEPNPAHELSLVDRDLSEARVLQERLRTSAVDDSQQLLSTIAIQIAHNSLEHAIYRRVEAVEPIPQLAEISHFLAVLRQQPQPNNSGELWLESLVEAVARYLIQENDQVGLQQQKATSTLIERILDRDNPLPQIDRELAMYFRDRLKL